MLIFVYLGVLQEYAKSLFASSPCTHRFCPGILRIQLNTFCTFGEFCVLQTTLNSPYVVKYFMHILRIPLDTGALLTKIV